MSSDGQHCCSVMKNQVGYRCKEHPDPFVCADNLVYFSEEFGEYGLIIHGGGSAYSTIRYCPWCGAKLPVSEPEEASD